MNFHNALLLAKSINANGGSLSGGGDGEGSLLYFHDLSGAEKDDDDLEQPTNPLRVSG